MGKRRMPPSIRPSRTYIRCGDRLAELKPDLVEAFKQQPCPRQAQAAILRGPLSSAFITQGYGLKSVLKKRDQNGKAIKRKAYKENDVNFRP